MDSQSLTEPLAQTALKCVLINAIPVLAFSIWSSTYREELEELEAEGREPDRSTAIQQIRTVAVLTLLGQVVAHLIAKAAAPLPQLGGFGIFFMALLIQNQLKFSLEKRIRKVEATPGQSTVQSGRIFLVTLGSLAVYFALAHGVARAARWVGSNFTAHATVLEAIQALGTLGGVALSLFVAFALAPRYLRLLLPCRKLDDAKTIELLDDCFLRAGVAPPEFWVLELERFGAHNALLAGLPRGRGSMQPALFLSRSLLEKFTLEELRAVMLHEASHLKLGHASRRWGLALGSMVVSVVALFLLVFAALLLLPAPLAFFFSLLAMFLPTVSAYISLKWQLRKQEHEADLHAVFVLGAELEAMASALRRLDRLNDVPSSGKASGSHPLTDERIRALRQEASRRCGLSPVDRGENHKQAA